MSQHFDIVEAAKSAKRSAASIAGLGQKQRKTLLYKIAELLHEQTPSILAANQVDLENAQKNGLSEAMVDRLALSKDSIQQIADSVIEVADQDDVLGSISQLKEMGSGIRVGKMRIPLGVIAMIYESRPNVTIDAAVLCLKAGNAVILRGGKEAQASNMAMANVIHMALTSMDLPTSIATVIPDPDRQVMQTLLSLNDYVDLLIPRGGEGLIRYVSENSRIPVIQHFKGVCHLYVDKDADLDIALNLLDNGKTQRTGVCNALETLLVHKDIADSFLPKVRALFEAKHVKAHVCEASKAYLSHAELATVEDWHAEYLALEIAVKQVDCYADAVAHIQEYGSGHTEVIVTDKLSTSQDFIKQVHSSVVMVNASSRFSDGGQLGLGAEIGISTSKLHAYGPMGAASLTTEKFVVLGEGQVRE